MFKEELIQLIQDPEVVEALWKAMFGEPVPSNTEPVVVPLSRGGLLQPDTEAAIKEVLRKPAQDTVPWDALDPRWVFAIRNPAGESFVCQEKPVKIDFGWRLNGGTAMQISGLIKGFEAGYCPWYDSLQERPRE